MLSPDDDLLVFDIKDLDYMFVSQTDGWRAISSKGNKAQQIVVVSRLRLSGGDTINARVEQFYKPLRTRSDDNLSLEDTRTIVFKDKEFADSLRNIRDK